LNNNNYDATLPIWTQKGNSSALIGMTCRDLKNPGAKC